MTSVPSTKTRRKDPFQVELDKEISKRRSKGLVTGFSDDDDDQDDYDDDDFIIGSSGDEDDLLKQYLQPKKAPKKPASKWAPPSYLDDDDDDSLASNDFLKDSSTLRKQPNKKTSHANLNRQKAVEPKDTKNPLLSLLDDSSDHSSHSKEIKKKKDREKISSPVRSLSPPSFRQDSEKKKTSEQTSISPRRPRTLKENNENSYKSQSIIDSLLDDSSNPTPAPRKNLHLERKQEGLYTRPDGKPGKSEVAYRNRSGSHGSIHRSRQVSAQDSRSESSHGSRPGSTHGSRPGSTHGSRPGSTHGSRPGSTHGSRPGSPHRSRPGSPHRSRSGTGGSTEKSQSTIKERVGSISHNRELSDHRKNTKHSDHQQLKSIENTTSTKDFLSSLPSIETKIQTQATSTEIEKSKREKHHIKKSSKRRSEDSDKKEKLSTSADDLLALFEQTTVSDDVRHSRAVGDDHKVVIPTEKTLLSHTKTSRENLRDEEIARNRARRRSSHKMRDIDDPDQTYVLHEDEYDETSTDATDEKHVSRKSKLKKSMKSPRTPPIGYSGLGSLTAFHQLRTYKKSQQNLNLNSTADLRNTAYMQWLSNRQKKLNEKKKLDLEAEEKENEKKEKEIQEKYMEGLSARKAWLSQKEEILKDEEKRKRRERRLEREEKLKREEEKWKSEKKANVVRERQLAEVKKQHRENLKKKREDEMLQKKKEQDKKKENKKAMDEWLEKRSKQWEVDRKAEMKEKKKKERELKEDRGKQIEEAQEKYLKWHAEKEEEMKHKHRTVYHDEERPAWSPANKVIPHRR